MAAIWGAQTAAFTNENNDFEVPLAGSDGIQCLEWAPAGNFLVSGGWDNKMRCFQIDVPSPGYGASAARQLREKAIGGPVLDVCWKDNGNVFAGGCDSQVTLWNLQTDQVQVVAKHSQPIKAVRWATVGSANALATGSWDKTIQYWDLRSPPAPVMQVSLPERVYSMDCDGRLLVAATADRQILIFDLSNPRAPMRKMASPLKFQTRIVKCFPDSGHGHGQGFGVASIEGRCSIRHADQNRDVAPTSFAFKCHRVGAQINAVNSIAFHPRYRDAFATCGADGSYVFWDKNRRKLLHQSKRLKQALTALRWNHDGTLLAYSCSYDWSMGVEYFNPQQAHNHIYIHHTQERELPKRR